jgi:hypothetical protein
VSCHIRHRCAHHSQAGGIPSIASVKMFRANGTADAGRMPAQGKAGKAVEQAAILPFACTRSAYHFQPPQHILSGPGSCTKVVFSLRTQQELYRRLYVAVRRRVGVSTATSLPSPYALTSLSPLSALSGDNCDTSHLRTSAHFQYALLTRRPRTRHPRVQAKRMSYAWIYAARSRGRAWGASWTSVRTCGACRPV